MLAPDFGLTPYQRQKRLEAHQGSAGHSDESRMHGFGDATTPATATPSRGGDLLMLAAAVVIAYKLGKAEGAKVKQAPSAAAIFAGYFGLKAMDKVFGRMTR
jgi:hypothetical protein